MLMSMYAEGSPIANPMNISVNEYKTLLIASTGVQGYRPGGLWSRLERDRLVLIDPASGATKPVGMGLAMGPPPGGPTPGRLTGLAVSKSGTIYIVGDIENVIYIIMPK
jgi:hypothetical protein